MYTGDLSAVTDLTTLTSLVTFTANKVTAVIGQDGANAGAALYLHYGKSISCLGAALGAVALSKVSESVAWVAKFDISDGSECDVPAFSNGSLLSSLSDNLINSINTQRYVFLRKFVGIPGSYFNDNHCACSPSSDYAYISDNRTIDKAIRGIYTSLLPDLNGPLVLNANGTLTDATIASLESDARAPLDVMVRDAELSTYGVVIDPAQNVLGTNKVVVQVTDIQVGVARNIEVDIKNAKSL